MKIGDIVDLMDVDITDLEKEMLEEINDTESGLIDELFGEVME